MKTKKVTKIKTKLTEAMEKLGSQIELDEKKGVATVAAADTLETAIQNRIAIEKVMSALDVVDRTKVIEERFNDAIELLDDVALTSKNENFKFAKALNVYTKKMAASIRSESEKQQDVVNDAGFDAYEKIMNQVEKSTLDIKAQSEISGLECHEMATKAMRDITAFTNESMQEHILLAEKRYLQLKSELRQTKIAYLGLSIFFMAGCLVVAIS